MLWNSWIYFFFRSTHFSCIELWLKIFYEINASYYIKACVCRTSSAPLASYYVSISLFVWAKSWRKVKMIVFLFSKEFFWTRLGWKRFILQFNIPFIPIHLLLSMHNSEIFRNIKFSSLSFCNISHFYCRNIVSFVHYNFSWVFYYVFTHIYILEGTFFVYEHYEGRRNIHHNK